jgi:hypothetical protein
MSNTYITNEGLNNWYCHIFSEVGWMFLAKRDNIDHKITHFKYELEDLIFALSERIKISESKDELLTLNLKIMMINSQYLLDRINTIL